MRSTILVSILAASLGIAPFVVAEDSIATFADDFSDSGTHPWQTWSPRAEIAPKFEWDDQVGRNTSGALHIRAEGNNVSFGAWKVDVPDITPGAIYRFEAWYRTQGVSNAHRSVIPRLLWKNEDGGQARPPDFATALKDVEIAGWSKVEYTAPAPTGATQVEIQLGFGFSEGQVWWDDVSLTLLPKTDHRTARIATIHHRPSQTTSAAASVAQFADLIEQAADQNPDLICLPEGITTVGNPLTYVEVAESIPGPTTESLGKLAAAQQCYIVAGIYERADKIVYNTAVLLDRSGKVAGTYRKTHLPREEWEAGITPGDSYPVFETDFGRVGIMICWDVQFPDPARAMALKGAEILLLPIWGGNEVLAKARAIENHVFLASSSYDMRSFVVDPTGNVVAEASIDQPIAITEIDLDQQFLQPWLGDMKHRTRKERRPDILVE